MSLKWRDWCSTGGGYYGSDNLTLACLREDIDQQPHQFKSILMGEKFRKTFFPSAGKDEKKVIAAFCKMSGDNALKTKPKVNTYSVERQVWVTSCLTYLLTATGIWCGPQRCQLIEAAKLCGEQEDSGCRDLEWKCAWDRGRYCRSDWTICESMF